MLTVLSELLMIVLITRRDGLWLTFDIKKKQNIHILYVTEISSKRKVKCKGTTNGAVMRMLTRHPRKQM